MGEVAENVRLSNVILFNLVTATLTLTSISWGRETAWCWYEPLQQMDWRSGDWKRERFGVQLFLR